MSGAGVLQLEWVPDVLLEWPTLFAAVLVLVGIVVGYLLGRLSRGVLEAAGVPGAVEGTAFERTARGLGTSTVSIISGTLSWFVYGVAVLAAIYVVRPTSPDWVWQRIINFIPNLFIATLVVVVGFVVADKVELVVSERLRGIKLPEVSVLPRIVRYSVLYVAFLVALSQIGVATDALLVLLLVYVVGFVVVGAVATKDMLSSGAAGIYLLLNQPYGIGDEVAVGEREGVVQEMDVFVTHLEADGDEHVVPNRKVFEEGITRRRS